MSDLTRRFRLASLTACAAAAILAGCSDSDSAPPKPKGPITPVDAATAGSIEVQVAYTGAPPTPKVINMSGTAACAALHSEPVLEQSVAVKDGRLANAVVYIMSGLGERAFTAPSAPVVIDQQGCLYDPRVVALMAGQALEFRNSDQEAHNVHGRPQVVKAWNFLMSRPNSSREVVLDRAEVGIPISCDVHPWMRAYASVFDHPYFAVTPDTGSVTLTTVPPGDYVVGVWHETLGTLSQPVTVPARGVARLQFTYPQR